MVDIICLGELLIDFISLDKNVSLIESTGFIKAPGGAPANVAVGVVKLGAESGFIGKVGNDPFGLYLKKVLKDLKVDTKNLVFDTYARTTLSYVALKSDGARDCMFYRNPGADMLLDENEIKEEYFDGANILHFGSISLGSPKSEKATLKAIEYAKKRNMIISYDPNLRLSLWDDYEFAKNKINSGFKFADFVKISDDEYEFITGTSTIEECAEYILNMGCKLVVITMGKNGCFYSDGKNRGYLSGYNVDTIETTGAGDAFVAAVLYHLSDRVKKGEESILKVSDKLLEILKFANCSGALATTKIGVIPSLPVKSEVDMFLAKYGDNNAFK